MLKRAFSTTTHQQGATKWKLRLCYVFTALIILSVAVLIIAWKMLCALPSSDPFQIHESDSKVKSLLNQSRFTNSETSRHKVEVYYEVLCPDSRHFIINDLIPAYDQLKDYIEPHFIPYGKATTIRKGPKISFQCQHGEKECSGNMIHACSTAIIEDEALLVRYITCMINNNKTPESIGIKCAKQHNIAWEPIRYCWRTTQGQELLDYYGNKTNALNPPVSFIPTIRIDGNQDGQKDILKNLKSYLCRHTLTTENPKVCW